jgi:hypothetical protein
MTDESFSMIFNYIIRLRLRSVKLGFVEYVAAVPLQREA